jgi:hypothetical protein
MYTYVVAILAHTLNSVTAVATRSVAVAIRVNIRLFSRRHITFGGKKLRLIIVSN